MTPARRPQVVRLIEDFIRMLNPDVIEAQELLMALEASLKRRFHEEELASVLHEFWRLDGALGDLDEALALESTEDEAYETYKAFQETH